MSTPVCSYQAGVKQGVSVTLRGNDLVLLGDVLAAAAARRLGRTNDTATDAEILDLADLYAEPHRAKCAALLRRVMDGYELTGGYDTARVDPPRTTGTVGTGTPPPGSPPRWAVPPLDPGKARVRQRFGITLLAAPNSCDAIVRREHVDHARAWALHLHQCKLCKASNGEFENDADPHSFHVDALCPTGDSLWTNLLDTHAQLLQLHALTHPKKASDAP